MKRSLALLLMLALLAASLLSCEKKPDAMLLDEDGYGVTNEKSQIHYVALSPAFEPAKTGSVVGEYVDRGTTYSRTFYEIPSLDTALYLADSELGVWCAAKALPDPAAMTPAAVLVCENKAVSVEIFRFTAGADDAVIAELRSLWLEGVAAERPVAAMTSSLGIKWQFAELSNVLYCLQLGIWEGVGAYLYDTFSGRAVAVPADLAAKLTAVK